MHFYSLSLSLSPSLLWILLLFGDVRPARRLLVLTTALNCRFCHSLIKINIHKTGGVWNWVVILTETLYWSIMCAIKVRRAYIYFNNGVRVYFSLDSITIMHFDRTLHSSLLFRFNFFDSKKQNHTMAPTFPSLLWAVHVWYTYTYVLSLLLIVCIYI